MPVPASEKKVIAAIKPAPDDAQDARQHRQQHTLKAAERPVLDEHDDQQRGAEKHRHLHEMGIRRCADDG